VPYYTLPLFAFFPGRIGSSGLVGTVQPQVDNTLLIINGALPVFVKIKSREPLSFLLTFHNRLCCLWLQILDHFDKTNTAN
jgi:hypothetical protein